MAIMKVVVCARTVEITHKGSTVTSVTRDSTVHTTNIGMKQTSVNRATVNIPTRRGTVLKAVVNVNVGKSLPNLTVTNVRSATLGIRRVRSVNVT